jgi:hypothetical protein
MNPELLSSLAAEHRRDLAAARAAGVPSLTLPRYRISWTWTSLAAAAGSRRGRSLVIVISAHQTSGRRGATRVASTVN